MQPTGFNMPYQPTSYPPYQPQLSQLQQTTRAVIFGKTVSDESQILPSDVPMDGSIAIFPLQDYTRIYAKQWTKNGTIQTMVYIPQPTQQETTANSSDLDILTSHIDSKIDEVLTALNKRNTQNKPKTYRKDSSGDNDA